VPTTEDTKIQEQKEESVLKAGPKSKEAPSWLKETAEKAGKSTNKAQITDSGSFSEGLPNLKVEKPSVDELGENPGSDVLIEEKYQPDLEAVEKVEKEAVEKLEKSGIEQKPQKAETKKSGLSILDKIKSFLHLNTKKGLKSLTKAKSEESSEQQIAKAMGVDEKERKVFIEAEKVYQEGLSSIKDLIAPSSFEVNFDSIRVDGMYARSFYVYSYPRYLDVNWLSPVVNFDVTIDVSQFIYPIRSEKIMKVLKKKVAEMQSSMRINAEKGQVRDPGLETALEDAEGLRTEIQRGQEKFFQFALYFTVYTDDEKKLERVGKQLESLLAGKLVMVKKTQLRSEHGFNSTIPICLDELYTVRNMNTGPLSTSFPFTSSDLTSDRGILYGLNRHNDSLIIFDRFSLENANSVVFAKSGAGKSYAVKLEILRTLMMGTDVVVIDPENEYESLSNMVGGEYLRMSLNSDRRINPFDLPEPLHGTEDVKPGDLLRSSIINLHGLLKIMFGGVSVAEASILDKALMDVYALKGITMETENPAQFEPPTMEDLYQILNSMEGATELVQKLSKFTSGSFSGIFNKPTNVDIGSGLMVFCIRDLEDELRPIAMHIILNYIWTKVRSKLKKRILVVDEAWTMMQHEDSAKFLFGLVKRARKYYLGVTTITQDVDDFMGSPFGKPIVTNSSMQLLLKQAPSSLEVLDKNFQLTEGEKYILLNSGVGQGLFFAGLRHVAIQVIASYNEDRIVTSNPEELLAAQDAKAVEIEKEKVESGAVAPEPVEAVAPEAAVAEPEPVEAVAPEAAAVESEPVEAVAPVEAEPESVVVPPIEDASA